MPPCCRYSEAGPMVQSQHDFCWWRESWSGKPRRFPQQRKDNNRHCGSSPGRAAEVNLLSPLVQALAPRTVRGVSLSHLRQTLNPGVPVLPVLPASFEAVGQWPVCYAGASLTEDPCPGIAFRAGESLSQNHVYPVRYWLSTPISCSKQAVIARVIVVVPKPT